MNGASILTKFFGDTKDLDEKTKKSKNTIADFAKSAGVAVAGMATAVEGAATAITKAFWDGAQATAQYGDVIDKNSQKVGMSTEAYQKWDYVLQLSGTSMENCTVGIKTLTNKLDDAINGGEGAQETFAKLGLSVDDLKNKSREDVFGMVITQLQGVEDETTKAALATEFFGKAGQDLIPLLNGTAEDTAKLMEEAQKYGMVMSDEAVKASAAFDDSLTKLNKTTDGLKNNLMSEFLPGLTDVINGFSDLLIGSEDAGETIEKGINSILEKVQNAIPKAVDMIMTIIPILLPALSNVIMAITQALMQNLPTIIQCGMDILLSLIMGIIQMTPQLIPTIVQCILTIITALTDNMDMIIDGAIQLILGLIDGIIMSIPLIIEAMPQIIMGVITGIIDNLPMLLTMTPRIIGMIVKGLIESIPEIFKAGAQILKGLWNGIKSMKDWVVNKVKDIGKSILKGIKGILGIKSPSKEFALIGKFSVLGYTEALDDMKKDIQEQVGETFGISPQVASSSALNYTPNVVVNNTVNMRQDPLGQMVNDIKTFSGGSKNDYNYGMGV